MSFLYFESIQQVNFLDINSFEIAFIFLTSAITGSSKIVFALRSKAFM